MRAWRQEPLLKADISVAHLQLPTASDEDQRNLGLFSYRIYPGAVHTAGTKRPGEPCSGSKEGCPREPIPGMGGRPSKPTHRDAGAFEVEEEELDEQPGCCGCFARGVSTPSD